MNQLIRPALDKLVYYYPKVCTCCTVMLAMEHKILTALNFGVRENLDVKVLFSYQNFVPYNVTL